MHGCIAVSKLYGMPMLIKGVSLTARNFKCFGSDEGGFRDLQRVNVIVRRNNSGKSTLLDLIEAARTGSASTGNRVGTLSPAEIFVRWRFTEEDFDNWFTNNSGVNLRISTIDDGVVGGLVEVKYSSKDGTT